MNESVFTIKSYGVQELATLYIPTVKPASAVKQLRRWIVLNENLRKELIASGWCDGMRLLTPIMVRILIRYLGAP